MKFVFTWKDPDYYDTEQDKFNHELPEEVRDVLDAMGIGEYLTVEVDTDAKTAIIVT